MTEMSKIDSRALLAQVTEFLWAEADLLDRKDYDVWLDLWQGTGFYTLPIGDTEDFANALNLCHDDAKMRRDRIVRFQQ
ncbi:MAG: aromatic-ring-hydroxylating dioxygenase subunit beta, partial [Gemmobacter sp.]